MIDFFVLALMVFVSVSILGVGFFKKQFVLVIISGILFFVVAAFFLSGINYVSGVVITELNSTSTVVTDVTSSFNNQFSIAFSLGFALLGLLFLIIGIILAFSKPKMTEDMDED